jgi:hypothetical protein
MKQNYHRFLLVRLAACDSVVWTTLASAATEAAARTATTPSPGAAAASGHPVVSVFMHLFFLTMIVAMGAAVVAALFKPPFQN